MNSPTGKPIIHATAWRRYWLLLLCQSATAGAVLWGGVPFYRRLMLGEHNSELEVASVIQALIVVAVMQSAFWRARQFPVPVLRARPFVAYLVMFLGRLTFVYIAGLFAVVFYIRNPDLRVGLMREALLLVVLFSMFCFTTELERLGKALLENSGSSQNSLNARP